MDLIETQLALEQDMVDGGYTRYIKATEDAEKAGRASDTKYGLAIFKLTLDSISTNITKRMNNPEPGLGGYAPSLLKDILTTDCLAFLALRTMLDGACLKHTLNFICNGIGMAVYHEILLQDLKDKNKFLFKKAQEVKTAHRGHRKKAKVYFANQAGSESEDWTENDIIQVGNFLLSVVLDVTGFFDISYKTRKGKTVVRYLTCSQKLLDWIKKYNDVQGYMKPSMLPFVLPPLDWTSYDSGVSYGDVLKMKLVIGSNNKYIETANNLDSVSVFRAINAMQSTAFKVNSRVLDVLKRFVAMNLTQADIPPMENPELPEKIVGMDEDPLLLKKWKREARKVYDDRVSTGSRRLSLFRIIQISEDYSKYSRIYFPVRLDFRGRAYTQSSFLNPQGADYSKALLTFAEGSRLTHRGVRWLKIHGANCYGEDKLSMDGREAWADTHHKEILSVNDNPFGECFEFWTNADKPWQFLAFCFEYAGWYRKGSEFISTLPIAMDGSCNGLQHFSAMLLDEVGGKSVNLVKTKLPGDVYKDVADLVSSELEKIKGENDMAAKWLAFGINRKLTKRSVMTRPYGSTMYACTDFIAEAVREQIANGAHNPFKNTEGDGVSTACIFITKYVWDAINKVMVGAKGAMDFLQGVASVVSKNNKTISWIVPDGFYVLQDYKKPRGKIVKCLMDGRRVEYFVRGYDQNHVDPKANVSGISPNFVHSLDAVALRNYVNKALDSGIKNFLLIHDSYASLANDVDDMMFLLRESFVELYRDNDVLADFLEELKQTVKPEEWNKFPELPVKGCLDISSVMSSEYFFS